MCSLGRVYGLLTYKWCKAYLMRRQGTSGSDRNGLTTFMPASACVHVCARARISGLEFLGLRISQLRLRFFGLRGGGPGHLHSTQSFKRKPHQLSQNASIFQSPRERRVNMCEPTDGPGLLYTCAFRKNVGTPPGLSTVSSTIQVRSDTWRFMGSYKWGYKSPNVGYNYSYLTYN